MSLGTTSVGPVEDTVRDRLKAYRDEGDHPNYNEALKALLENGESER